MSCGDVKPGMNWQKRKVHTRTQKRTANALQLLRSRAAISAGQDICFCRGLRRRPRKVSDWMDDCTRCRSINRQLHPASLSDGPTPKQAEGDRVEVPDRGRIYLSGGALNTLSLIRYGSISKSTLPFSRCRKIAPKSFCRRKRSTIRCSRFSRTARRLAERLTSAQDDARLDYQRVLLVVGDANSDASQRLEELREKDWRRATLRISTSGDRAG